ncbi:MAG: hypothetical protein FWG32_09815 [Oscillospiraceae bacterium]|nr:hypothetical protein [Oscillospiraceae bacterium]
MRKHVTVTLCFTCTAGAFSVFFRWLQLITAFEADSGLPVRNAWASLAVIAVTLFSAAMLAVLTLISRKHSTRAAPCSKLPAETAVFSAVSWIAGILTMAGAVMIFISGDGGSSSVGKTYAGLAFIAGFGYPAFISLNKRSSGFLTCLLSLIPVVFCSYWLIISYKDHAANPVIWEFVFEILAISASILSFFFVAGYPCGSPKPAVTFYFCNLAAYLCIVTLADAHPFPQTLIFLSMALIGLLYAGAALNNENKT